MGDYTEILVNVDFVEDLPKDIVDTIKAMCDGDYDDPILEGKPYRWTSLFSSGSFYTVDTACANFTYSEIGGHWSLLGKGDIKNYDEEIQKFFKYIEPYTEGSFMGYMQFEDSKLPTLMVKGDKDYD